MRIKVLKDTPFDKAGDILSIKDFRLKYPYLCVNSVSDKELFDHIHLFTVKPVENSISDWFAVVPEHYWASDYPLEAIIDGILYAKQQDGLYHQFIAGNEFKSENSLGSIHIGEFERRVKDSKYHKVILYCTNNVNKKL